MKMKKAQAGFTLVELMIVVGIIAIVAAVGYPSYQNSVRKTNRVDAMNTIMDTAQQLERCFTTYGKYDHASCNIQAGNIASPKQHYNVTVATTATTFTLTAIAQAGKPQAQDTRCGNFSLTNTGVKAVTGPDGVAKCW